jgi:uridine kinase
MKKLFQTYMETRKWNEMVGVENLGQLNSAVLRGQVREIIQISEGLHEKKIAQIADMISQRRPEVKLVLIAGPSASGKTTFSKRLAVQLLTQGLSPFPLELDNYFVDREKTPRDEHGNYDFEHIDALDRERLAADVGRLLRGEEVQLPRYNFKEGRSEPGEVVQLAPDQLIIMEGIHGLDPRLLPGIPREQTFRIYASALTQLNLDCHNRVSTTDTRLIRRIVRDARDRGYTAEDTIGRWEAVRRGEKRWIFPFQEEADVMFNSALVYELAVLKPFAVPLLLQVPHHTSAHIEAKRLLSLLEWFVPLDASLVPDDSLLREFVGGSILREFLLWQNGMH